MKAKVNKESIVKENKLQLVVNNKKKELIRNMGCQKCSMIDWRF